MRLLDPNFDDNVAKVTQDLEKLVEENGLYKQSLQIKARAVRIPGLFLRLISRISFSPQYLVQELAIIC